MALKVHQKFPPRLAFVHRWLFPEEAAFSEQSRCCVLEFWLRQCSNSCILRHSYEIESLTQSYTTMLMHTRGHTHKHIHIHTHTQTHKHTQTHIRKSQINNLSHTITRTHARMRTRTRARTSKCAHKQTTSLSHTHMCIYIYVYHTCNIAYTQIYRMAYCRCYAIIFVNCCFPEVDCADEPLPSPPPRKGNPIGSLSVSSQEQRES